MPEANGNNQPASRADVHALEARMEGRLQTLEEKILSAEEKILSTIQSALAQAKAELTESLQEFVRDSQTELLRGFQAYATGFDTRLAKLGADFSILDQATERRLTSLERRMLEIEIRFPPMTPPPSAG